MNPIELLAPARDLAVGMAAVDNGADAVYIGAPAFGARKAAANSLKDIARLVEYAHRYYCRVYVTLNTILYDEELPAVERMVGELYAIGVDALIVQDMGILRLQLPPIALHASTQMHNYDLERIKFLDRMGFTRIVLARELSLERIREIRREVKAELEVFVHGALCVSLSGQCYLSQYMFGRSANRGECAQPCRQRWNVEDAEGKRLVEGKHILSLKDLNLSAYVGALAEAGVTSLKIEGRLKDAAYVANVTAHYSALLGRLPSVKRCTSGVVQTAFDPAPGRTFNRGFTTYFAEGRQAGMANPATPKSLGMRVGVVAGTQGRRMRVVPEEGERLANGDGLCYMKGGELFGVRVERVAGEERIPAGYGKGGRRAPEGNGVWLECNEAVKVPQGTVLYRNYDRLFVAQLERGASSRRIPVSMSVEAKGGRLCLKVEDGEGCAVEAVSGERFEEARNPGQLERLETQLTKCGDTVFVCTAYRYLGGAPLFVPAAAANELRRHALERLAVERERHFKRMEPGREEREVRYPLAADWRLNVANKKAAEFYRDHGVEVPEPALEVRMPSSGCELMRTRYCILHELGRCRKQHGNADIRFPLVLCNDRYRFRLEFDCRNCFMSVLENENTDKMP